MNQNIFKTSGIESVDNAAYAEIMRIVVDAFAKFVVESSVFAEMLNPSTTHRNLLIDTSKRDLEEAIASFDKKCRENTIKKLEAINEIQDFLEEHPIGMINEEALMKWSLSSIRSVLEGFKDDLVRKPGE